MQWTIVTDSGCDLQPADLAPNISLRRVPLSILLGGQEWTDGADLDAARLIAAMEAHRGASGSACPSPEAWARAFSAEGFIIAIALTGGLSGSYNSAILARNMVWEREPAKHIFVLDSRSAAAEIALLVWKAQELIQQGLHFNAVAEALDAYRRRTGLLFMLEHVDNFVKNGRLNKLAGAAIGILGMRIVGRASEQGVLQPLHKPRGAAKGMALLLDEMEKRGFAGGKAAVTHVQNRPGAERLVQLIQERWPAADTAILPASGLCSYYGERHGLLVGFESGDARRA